MVWGKPETGAWANAVEEEEQEHGTIQAPAVAERDFPTLGAAVTVKETKKDKKKKQTMSLSEFMGAGSRRSRNDDDSILLDLPTGPRVLAEGEAPPDIQLGGGFRGYGGDRGGRGGGGRFNDEDRPPRRRDEEDLGPSRADATDNWGAERKFVPGGSDDRYGGGRGGGGFRDREERGGFGDGGGGGGFRAREDRPPREFDDGPSRADTGDWGARQFVPSEAPRRGSFEGARDSFRERDSSRGGEYREREAYREPSRADVESRWERHGDAKPIGFDDRPRREFEDGPPRERRGFSDGWRGRERDDVGPSSRDGSQDRWLRASPAPGGGGSHSGDDQAPKERPKLKLQPRTAPVEAPAPAAVAAGGAAAGGARPSIFGAARPREEVLKEQGRDAVKEDERLEAAAVKAPPPHSRGRREREPTEEETAVKTQLEEAKKAAEAEGSGDAEKEAVTKLEEELKGLQLELDEKSAAGRRGRENGRGASKERAGGERAGSQRRERDSFRSGAGKRGSDDGASPAPRKDRW